MTTIGERIKKRRQELGYSVEDIAKKLGKNRATVYRYESGDIENMPTYVLEPLAIALDTTPAELLGWERKQVYDAYADAFNDLVGGNKDISHASMQKYPVLGRVACGKPIIENEEYDVLSDGRGIKADAVVIARGDSMTGARIYDGDIVFVRLQNMVENGDIAVVEVINDDTEDAEVTLKRFFRYSDDIVVLRAENPLYQDMVFHGDDINRLRVIGKAVAFQGTLE